MDSAVPSGRTLLWTRTQTRCVWLISGCPFRTSGRVAGCMVAVSKDWPDARTGAKGQRSTHGRAGAGWASPAGTGAGAAGRFGGRSATRWKLASYEVAGHAFVMLVRPERTRDSTVPPGRILFWTRNQTRCVWLISGCPAGTSGMMAACMVADRKVWPDARTGAKGQRPSHGRAGARLASPAGIGAGADMMVVSRQFGNLL